MIFGVAEGEGGGDPGNLTFVLNSSKNIFVRFCRKNQRSGRDCTIEGQIPILVFWPI